MYKHAVIRGGPMGQKIDVLRYYDWREDVPVGWDWHKPVVSTISHPYLGHF